MRKLLKTMYILIAIALAILFVGCTATNGGESGSTNELPNVVGIVREGIDVPEEVLSAAKEETKRMFEMYRGEFPDYDYINWRVENLGYAYTYMDIEGMILDIYQMNYEILAESPEKIMFAGGMYITEDNWVMPDYPNSRYLVFHKEDDKLNFLCMMFENDCIPGDDIFTEDLLRVLDELKNQA